MHGSEIKQYLKTLWYDASYPDSDQTNGLSEPRYLKEVPNEIERFNLTPIEKLYDLCDKNCFESMVERRSRRSFDLLKSITIDQLSFLLFCTQGIRNKEQPRLRMSPTGGARCSIETYVYIGHL